MDAVIRRICPLVGALIVLTGCYSNNGGLLGSDGPNGQGGQSGVGGASGSGGTGSGTGGQSGAGGNAGGAGGSGGGAGAGGGHAGGSGGAPLDGQWQPPTRIESHSGTGFHPHVAISDAGDAVAVWVRLSLGEFTVRTNVFTSGSGWDEDTWLGSTDGDAQDLSRSSRPYVVFDPTGVATAAWSDFDDPILRGVVSRRFDGGSWSGVASIYDEPTDAGNPVLSADAQGRVAAVFSTGTGAWANYFETTGGWGDPEIIDNAPNQPVEVRVALQPSGPGWAVWSQAPNGLLFDIFASRFDPASGWDEPFTVDTTSIASAQFPEVAVGGNGDAVVVWQQSSGLNTQVLARTWNETAAELANPLRIDTGSTARAPTVAADPEGRATVVWIQSSPRVAPDLQVVAARFSRENGWGEPQILAQGAVTSEPRVAMDAASNAVVVYALRAESETQVDAWAHTYSGGQWGGPVRLGEDAPNGDAFQPSVAMDPNGNAVVVWREGQDIWASLFE